MDPERSLTLELRPGSGGRTRTLEISHRRLRWVLAGAITLGALLILLAGSWVYLAVRARQATLLEVQVAELLEREVRVAELAETLAEIEEGYARIRSLFGADGPTGAAELWLPPAVGRTSGLERLADAQQRRPTSWPLTERGFVTQGLLAGAEVDHPGIDIAVPAGSYVRAAGSGTVVERGEDEVYGHYLVIDHGDGYRSRYAHASVLFAAGGDEVRQNEVIALSGSSGRSTAPHLHFEIVLEEVAVDPLTMVEQP